MLTRSAGLAGPEPYTLLTAIASISAGDPIQEGSIVGVALSDTDGEGNCEVEIGPSIHLFTVEGKNGTGNQAVAIGDTVYLDGGSGGTLNVDTQNGVAFGIALGAVASGNTATAIDVLILPGKPALAAGSEIASFSFAAAAGGANVSEVTITALDADGNTIDAPWVGTVFLSDSAVGAGLTATSASGTVTAKSASGAVFGTLTAKKALVVQALATGAFILEITDTAKTTFYVAAEANGIASVSDILATGDYG